MNRTDFIATTIAAVAAPVKARVMPIVAEVTLTRDAAELLAPFVVSIALNNTSARAVALTFPTADLFRIDVLRDDTPVWSSLNGHKPIPVNRIIDVPPGRTRLASMTIDSETDDKRAYASGKYLVRVAMLGTSFGMIVDREITFAPPMPIADVLRLKPGTVVSIAGEQLAAGGFPVLRDATGTVRLSRSLALRPVGPYVVRGFLDASGDDRIFDIGRFAPAFENAPSPSP